MVKMLMALVIVLLIGMASAQDIRVDYPEEVLIGEEFTFRLDLFDFPEKTFDVKIDAETDGGKRVSRIFEDDKWKSTFYYIPEIIQGSESREFLMIVPEYLGEAHITVKIRDPSGNVESFPNYKINIISSSHSNQELDGNEEIPEGPVGEYSRESELTKNEIEHEIVEFETIRLGTQNIKTEENTVDSINDVESNLSEYAIYGFISFFVLLAVLFALKLNRGKNGLE